MSPTPVRWLFGDQLGQHFTDDHDGQFLLVESKAVFRRRRFHRAKAHLVLSAMRHRAAELGDRVTYVQADGYADAVRSVGRPIEVIHPTSYAALGLVERLGEELDLTRPASQGVRHRARGLRGLGGRSGSAAAADGGLLPGGAAAARRTPRRRRPRRRPLELRPRQPRATAEGRDDARRTRPLLARRGRDRRAGARRPRPVGAGRRGLVHRRGRAAPVPGHQGRGAGLARPVHR